MTGSVCNTRTSCVHRAHTDTDGIPLIVCNVRTMRVHRAINCVCTKYAVGATIQPPRCVKEAYG